MSRFYASNSTCIRVHRVRAEIKDYLIFLNFLLFRRTRFSCMSLIIYHNASGNPVMY